MSYSAWCYRNPTEDEVEFLDFKKEYKDREDSFLKRQDEVKFKFFLNELSLIKEAIESIFNDKPSLDVDYINKMYRHFDLLKNAFFNFEVGSFQEYLEEFRKFVNIDKCYKKTFYLEQINKEKEKILKEIEEKIKEFTSK